MTLKEMVEEAVYMLPHLLTDPVVLVALVALGLSVWNLLH